MLVLGAGVAGLAAAGRARRARGRPGAPDGRPGGLVRKQECFDGFWFDRVIHVLYFPDDDTEREVRRIVGRDLVGIAPSARVETPEGSVAFPLQLHLGGLDREVAVRCTEGFVRAALIPADEPPANYEEMLRQSFGEGMCETFFLPSTTERCGSDRLTSLRPRASTGTSSVPRSVRCCAGLPSLRRALRRPTRPPGIRVLQRGRRSGWSAWICRSSKSVDVQYAWFACREVLSRPTSRLGVDKMSSMSGQARQPSP